MQPREVHMGVRRVYKTGNWPPGNWDWEGKISGKRENSSLILISWVNSCNDSLFADMTLTLHKSQVHCFGNMQLWACSSIRFFACRGRLRNSRTNCSTIDLCCVTIKRQQIFEDALQVMAACVLPHVTIERRHLGRWCRETATADGDKARRFIPGVTNLFAIAGHFVSYRWVSGPHNFLVILWNLLKTKKIVHQQKQTTEESMLRGPHVRHLWFIPMVGELRVADIFCVALLGE